MRRWVGVAACAVVLSACSGSVTLSEPSPSTSSSPRSAVSSPSTSLPPSPSPRATTPRATTPPATAPTTRAQEPATKPPPLDDWEVGASPLPLRPDGFGMVLRTPKELRVRRMPTQDLLPPPQGGRFTAGIDAISSAVRERMGTTWGPHCPVDLDDLRYVTVSFWGFDARPHTGELVVNARVARDVVTVFRRLFAARFPIEQMRLVTTADLDAPPTGDGNNTAAFVCRSARGSSSWSAHAYGLAIDVNPFQNPYSKADLVLPELASAYLDRGWRRPGMVRPGGVVVEAFADIGWGWGGRWQSLTDRMHFSATGR